MSYKIEVSPKGVKTLIYYDEETQKKVRLHSAYNPYKEAERAVSSFTPGRSKYIFVTGLALGYHIEILKNNYPNHTICILEEDSEVIKICKKENPEVLNNIFVIQNLNDVSTIFEGSDISSFKGFKVFYFNSSYNLSPKFYDNFLKEINQYISSRISDLLTRFEFEEVWADNIIKNIPKFSYSPSILPFFQKFRNIPGVIISAGPSLKKNAPLLTKLREKALLVCVDTALPVMRRYNIKPHLVITLDAQKHSLIHFLSDSEINPILIADMVSYPAINRDYKGITVFSSTAKYYDNTNGGLNREPTPFMDWLEEHIEPMGDIQSGGSVATSAFDLLLNLGCSEIVLIGQDLAYTGREIHSSGTHHNDKWLTITNRFLNLQSINQNIIRKRKIKYVESFNNRAEVLTDFVLDMYKNWFSDSAGRVPIDVINVTEGGAQIKNTKEMTLKKYFKTITSLKRNPEDILTKTMDNISRETFDKKRTDILDAVNSSLSEISNLGNSAELFLSNRDISLFKKIVEKAESPNLNKLLKPYMKKTNTYINRHLEISEEEVQKTYIREIIRICKKLNVHFTELQNKLHDLKVS